MVDAKFFNPDKDEDQFDIHIDYDGTWYHKGTPITRDGMAKLFSTVLHFDPKTNEYWLVTPHEQGRISVEDAPYVVTNHEFDGTDLILETNLGHTVSTDKTHPITCDPITGIPYIIIQNNAKARINRALRDRLIQIAIDQNGYNETTGTLTLKCNNTRHIIAIDTDNKNASAET